MLMSAPVSTHWTHRLRKLRNTKTNTIAKTTITRPAPITQNEPSVNMARTPLLWRRALRRRTASAKRIQSDFLHDNPHSFDLDDLHPAARRYVVSLGDHVEELAAELGLAGRTQRCHRDAHGAEQFHHAAVRDRCGQGGFDVGPRRLENHLVQERNARQRQGQYECAGHGDRDADREAAERLAKAGPFVRIVRPLLESDKE